MIKKLPKMAPLMLFFLVAAELSAQAVAPGWRVATVIKAEDDLAGAWDVIAGLDLDKDGFQEFIFTKDPVASGYTIDKSVPQSVYYYESTGDDTYELRWSFSAPFSNTASNIYSAIAVGDLDQDGLTELYFGTPLSPTDSPPNPRGLYVFEHDGTNFPATPSETWNMA